MEPPYIHGYGDWERDRLHRQAQFLAPRVHERLPFGASRRLLEVGCGVGGQSAILLRAFPELRLVGVDVDESQLAEARRVLASQPDLAARSEFERADALDLRFDAGEFDGAFLCWILEHLPEPKRALTEVRRVLSPGSPIVCTEVQGSSLWLDPFGPDIASYWRAFNDHQIAPVARRRPPWT